MPNLKKMPSAKQQNKYFGRSTVSRITDGHAYIFNPIPGYNQQKKIPIDDLISNEMRNLAILLVANER